MRRTLSTATALALFALATMRPAESHLGEIAQERFYESMHEVATGWSAGDAERAATCFAENAVYSEPPARRADPRERATLG